MRQCEGNNAKAEKEACLRRWKRKEDHERGSQAQRVKEGLEKRTQARRNGWLKRKACKVEGSRTGKYFVMGAISALTWAACWGHMRMTGAGDGGPTNVAVEEDDTCLLTEQCVEWCLKKKGRESVGHVNCGRKNWATVQEQGRRAKETLEEGEDEASNGPLREAHAGKENIHEGKSSLTAALRSQGSVCGRNVGE